jgi:carboxylate-amine ligase
MQSVVEIATPVCRNTDEVRDRLVTLRSHVARLARDQQCRLGSAGTHPFSLFEHQLITEKERYHQLVDQLQHIARQELIFGMHVHIAVDEPEKAIQVVNGLSTHIAQLLALSASSPFWRGEPTGLRSSRQMVFSTFPRSGVPPRFADYADYAALVGQLEATECIVDYTHIWWDIRLHPRLGTIEVRVCDAVTRLDDTVALAAFIQALVKMYCEQVEAGKPVQSFHRILNVENKWRVARYGLEAPVIDLAAGNNSRLPVSTLIRQTLRDLEPHARELGSERDLEGIAEILARGNGADLQLRSWDESHDIVAIVREIAAATEIGLHAAA